MWPQNETRFEGSHSMTFKHLKFLRKIVFYRLKRYNKISIENGPAYWDQPVQDWQHSVIKEAMIIDFQLLRNRHYYNCENGQAYQF